MSKAESVKPPAADRSEPFGRVEASGPVRTYLDELGRRSADAIHELLGGTPDEQARAKEELTRQTAEYALARQFDEEYFGRVWCVGHTQALEQVSSELEAVIRHHSTKPQKALLEALETIKSTYDQEGRATVVVPTSPSAD